MPCGVESHDWLLHNWELYPKGPGDPTWLRKCENVCNYCFTQYRETGSSELRRHLLAPGLCPHKPDGIEFYCCQSLGNGKYPIHMPKEDTVAVGDPLINRYCYYVRRQLKRYPNDAMTLAWVEQVEARLKRMGLSGLDFQADKFHKKLRCRKRADRSDYGFNEGVSMSIEEFDIVRRKEHFAKRPRGSGPRIRKRSKPIKGLKRGQTLPAPDRQLESDAEAVLSGEEGMEEEDEEARAATWVSKKSSARIQTKNKPKPAATAQPPAPTPPQSKPPAAASAKATTTTAASAATKPAGSASGGLKRKSKAASRAKTVSTSAANLTEAAKKDVVVPAEAPTAQPSPRATRASKRLKATAPAVDSSALPPPDGTQANSTLTPSQSTPVNQTAPPPSKAAPKKGRPPRLQLTDPDASEPVPAPEVQNKSTSKRASKKTVKKTAPRSSRAKQSKSLPSEPDTGDGTANAVQLEDTLARALQVRDADKTPAQRKSEAAAAARYAQLYGGLGSVVALKAYCMDMERKYASDALQRKPDYVLRKMALRTVVTGQPISVSGKSLPSSGSPPSQDADTEEAGTGAPEDMDVSDGEVSDSGSSVSDIPIPKLWDSPTKDRYDIGPEECNKVKPHSGEVVDKREVEDVFPFIEDDTLIDYHSKVVLYPLVSSWWYMCENAYITDLEFDEFIAGCSKFSEVKEKLSKKFELFDATVFGLTAAWLNLNLGCWFVRGATLRSLWTRRHLYAHRCFGYMAWEWPNWMAACLQDYNISQYEAALSSNRRQKGKEAVSSAVSSRRSTPSNASELTPVPADLEDVPATNDNEIIANQLQSDLKTTDGNSQGGDRAPVLASSAAPTASKKRKGMSREMASLGVASSDKVDINAPRQKRNRRK